MKHAGLPNICKAVVAAMAALAASWLHGAPPADGSAAKRVLDARQGGENLVKPDAWRPWKEGFRREGEWIVCDNGGDFKVQRGAGQSLLFDQKWPEPVVASAWSKADAVGGSADSNYSIYLDMVFQDDSHLWGQAAPFDTGTHDWQRRQVIVLPEKPIKSISLYVLLRSHSGKAWFRDVELRAIKTPAGAAMFDGLAVIPQGPPAEGFQVRDVAAGTGFVHLRQAALGLRLQAEAESRDGATFWDVTLADTTVKDRAVTLIYTVPIRMEQAASSRRPLASDSSFAKGEERTRINSAAWVWLEDPRRSTLVEPGREYSSTSNMGAGANGRMSRYPFGAVAGPERGVALGIDMAHPAFFRTGYNAGTGELFLAYDIGLAPEKPSARVRFCRFEFDAKLGFRGALARYYELFPEAFRRRTSEQGLWMPFAKISEVRGWEDFGFKFKEGNNETAWDDAHGIITFRYTEPMTWWMRMPEGMPRTLEAALAEAKRLAAKDNLQAKALWTSGYHDAQGRFAARMLDTPWCNGAVWSMNSMPGVRGEVTDFKNKWNPAIREQLYGPRRRGDLDGEYVDSSEGYVTDVLDFRRDHFSAADTPLVFSTITHRPAVFRGLISFEYIRGIERDIHGMNKLMMANGAPGRLPWLAPLLDVMGTETNWNRNNRWQPMSDAELLYRRALTGSKPYCFLMNTRFEDFSRELVEKYMKRALAYGMFPGFFSPNASQGHYFTRPEFYERDRGLFKKYVPLCKLVAQAGWEPITRAATSDPKVYVERFGDRYLTVFNDSPEPRTVTIRLDGGTTTSGRDLLSGRNISWRGGETRLALGAEDVAMLEVNLASPGEKHP